MYINTTHLTLQDVASFTLKNNPSKQFKERWGDEYVSRAMSLWRGVKKCYLKSEECNFTAQELLFAMSYEYAVAPYPLQINLRSLWKPTPVAR